jgi:hypothetical protein
MEQSNNSTSSSPIERPTLLKVLIFLSFLGSSWNMFSGLSNAMSQPSEERVTTFIEIMDQVKDDSEETAMLVDEVVTYVSNINQNIVNYGAVEFMLYAISLIGVFLMYRNRRIGFTIYMIVQVLLLGVPIFFGGYSSFSLTLTILFGFVTMVFFALYSTQLKYMDA